MVNTLSTKLIDFHFSIFIMNCTGNKDTQLTQLQSLLNDQFMNIPLVRIPYIDNKMNEEISVSSNSTTFVFPGVEGT